MRARRIISAVAAAVVVVGLLTGCQARTGAAAFVGSQEITESQVRTYIERDAPATAATSSNSLATLVLEQLVDVAVFTKVFKELNITPSASDLAQLHDAALQNVLGDSSTGATADQELRAAAARLGLRASFDPVLIKAVELGSGFSTILSSGSDTQKAALAKAVTALKVKVSPRYGSWDPTQLQITANGGRLPFVDLKSIPTAAASAG